MDETTPEQSGGVDRRTVLRRAAIGGAAVVWATPVVQTLGMGVAAAATGFQLQGCPDGDSPKPSRLEFTYQPNECDGSHCSDSELDFDGQCNPDAEGALTKCDGDAPTGNASLSARIRNPGNVSLVTNMPVSSGDPVVFDSGGCGTNGNGLGNNIEVTITSDSGTQIFEFHTSCSAPLIAGHRFGSLIFQGGVFDC